MNSYKIEKWKKGEYFSRHSIYVETCDCIQYTKYGGGGFCHGASVQIPWDDRLNATCEGHFQSHGHFCVSHQSGGKMDGFLKWEYMEVWKRKERNNELAANVPTQDLG